MDSVTVETDVDDYGIHACGKTIKIKTFSPLFALSPLTCDKSWRTDSYDQFDITIE